VVHTDDVAWWHAAFGWAGLLAEVLGPLRAGRAVVCRPFLAADRPWEWADPVVGTPSLPHDARTELVVADPPRPPAAA
jgi:hypothetical protein